MRIFRKKKVNPIILDADLQKGVRVSSIKRHSSFVQKIDSTTASRRAYSTRKYNTGIQKNGIDR